MFPIFSILSPFVFMTVVLVAGLMTPGYNHLQHTISRLAIEKYGYVQQLNFVQLSIALLLSGKLIAESLTHPKSRNFIKNFYNFSSFLLIIAAVFPTDKLESAKFSIKQFSVFGLLHLTIVLTFIVISPFAINRLYKIFQDESRFRPIAKFTAFMGYAAFAMSIAWIILFVSGSLGLYRGLYQKIIAIWTIIWLTAVNYKALKSRNSGQKAFASTAG